MSNETYQALATTHSVVIHGYHVETSKPTYWKYMSYVYNC